MAEHSPRERDEGFLAGAAGIVQAVRESVNEAIAPVAGPLLRDGHLAAAFRQGIDEIGMALKAFPDAIQAHEYGTVFSPTQGEIAAGRKGDLPTPSQIVQEARQAAPEQERGHVHGNDHGQDHGHSR
jgi:hypothetical protein